jgi:leucyl aminopeptidase
MFNLNVKAADKKISYDTLSVSVKYLIDEKDLQESLKNLEKIFNVKFSKLQEKNFTSKDGKEIRVTKPSGKPDALIINKVKIDKTFSSDYYRNHLAGLIKNLSEEKLNNLHIFIPSFKAVSKYFDSESYYYQTFIEGLFLGNYNFDKYKSSKKELKKLDVLVHADNNKLLKNAIAKTIVLMNGVNFTKDLQNEPANSLLPSDLAKILKARLTNAGVKVTVFDEKEIKKRKMGGLLAVGQGSANKPRFIILEYKPLIKAKERKKKLKKIALVGKGITFDSGGISIKPALNMGEMKADMSGAAVVAGSILAAVKAKLPVEILGVIPAAENMLSGESMRPGDIVTTSSGKTIEVDNTDAEGRLILSDALYYASQHNPDVIIDFATLTGACVVALAQIAAGLFTKSDDLADALYKSGMRTYDRLWRMPMWDDYSKLIESKIADVHNTGPRWGGAVTAAKFLEHFVDEKIPWAHIDIAGPAYESDTNNYTKTFMTGFGVRLVFDYLSSLKNSRE